MMLPADLRRALLAAGDLPHHRQLELAAVRPSGHRVLLSVCGSLPPPKKLACPMVWRVGCSPTTEGAKEGAMRHIRKHYRRVWLTGMRVGALPALLCAALWRGSVEPAAAA